MLIRSCAAVLLLALMTACGDDSAPDAGEPASTPVTSVDETTTATASTSDQSTAPSTAPSTPPSTPTSPPTSRQTKPGTRIVAADSEFGQMLFDATGQAIYLFDVETTRKPQCYGACAEAWPPVLTDGDPVAAPGIASSMLATTKRTDGTVQVTYNDHPLYFYAHEGKGEVKCHDVFLNGGNWYVVQPDGDAAPPG